jgi:Fe-Mn family superoxide dismutase
MGNARPIHQIRFAPADRFCRQLSLTSESSMPQIYPPAASSYRLPDLPFATDALEPYISRETVETHYGEHHRAYVARLNELINGSSFEGMPLAEVVRQSSGPLFNTAAQAWNHSFYWCCLSPGVPTTPSRELARAIDAAFGSREAFANLFKTFAAAKFASGWTWLVRTADGGVAIRNSNNAENPLRWNQTALLACDVWEHAYYLDYRSERVKYVDAFWRLINWSFVSHNFAAK